MPSKSKVVLGLCWLALALILTGCQKNPHSSEQKALTGTEKKTALLVYSGSGLKKPVEEIGAAYERQTGVKVVYVFGGSSQLISQIKLSKQGDVFLPGDLNELDALKDNKMVVWERNLVYHVPVLAVPRGNPANIQRLADLARPGVKVALGDPQANPIGKIADQVLQEHGLLPAVNRNVVVRTAAASELMVYLNTRQVDAAIIWRENLRGGDNVVQVLAVPELNGREKIIPAAVLSCTKNRDEARRLAEFFASQEAIRIWQKWGYQTVRS